MAINRLNHAVLYVRDAERTATFFEDVLGFRRLPDVGAPRRGVPPCRGVDQRPRPRAVLRRRCRRRVAGRPQRGRAVPPRVGGRHARRSRAVVEAPDGRRRPRRRDRPRHRPRVVYGKDPDGLEFELTWIIPAAMLDRRRLAHDHAAARSRRRHRTLRRRHPRRRRDLTPRALTRRHDQLSAGFRSRPSRAAATRRRRRPDRGRPHPRRRARAGARACAAPRTMRRCCATASTAASGRGARTGRRSGSPCGRGRRPGHVPCARARGRAAVGRVRRRHLHGGDLVLGAVGRPVGVLGRHDVGAGDRIVERRVHDALRDPVGDPGVQRRLADAAGERHAVAVADAALLGVGGWMSRTSSRYHSTLRVRRVCEPTLYWLQDPAGREEQRVAAGGALVGRHERASRRTGPCRARTCRRA